MLHNLASCVAIDQNDRQITLPDRIDRLVVLPHQPRNLLLQLNATDRIVGKLDATTL